MIIFIPEGSDIDHTRPTSFYDGTYEYPIARICNPCPQQYELNRLKNI
jgi:hypothetical protein